MLPYFTLSKRYRITFVLAFFFPRTLFDVIIYVIFWCYQILLSFPPFYIFTENAWHMHHFFNSFYCHFTFRKYHRFFLCFLLLIFWGTSSVFSDWYEWWGEWRKCRKCDDNFVTKKYQRLSMNVRFVPRRTVIISYNYWLYQANLSATADQGREICVAYTKKCISIDTCKATNILTMTFID